VLRAVNEDYPAPLRGLDLTNGIKAGRTNCEARSLVAFTRGLAMMHAYAKQPNARSGQAVRWKARRKRSS